MKKSMMWASLVGVVGAVALAGCQKHEDAAPVTPEASTPATQQAAPATAPSDTSVAPSTTTDAPNTSALPSDQSDDMSNMNSTDAAKPSTLPDSQSGTAEDNR